MKVLVTGGAGFIGSRLSERLLQAGHGVHVVDDLSLGTERHLEACRKHASFEFTKVDCNAPEFAAVVRAYGPERLFHLAANSDIGKGTQDPTTDLQRTFMTTYSVLEAMRQASCKDLVFASTSAIYGEAPGQIQETHGPLEPISLYGAAKLSSEAYANAYCHLFGMRARVFRFPNVIGPNLTHGAVFDFVRRLSKDRTHLKVLGNGTQTKPYIDVDDLIDAILLGVGAKAEPVSTYNIAGEGATSVRAIAEMVREELGLPQAEIEFGVGDRGWPGDVPRFAYDTSKIRGLGWKPKYTSDEAVRRAVRAEAAQCKPSS